MFKTKISALEKKMKSARDKELEFLMSKMFEDQNSEKIRMAQSQELKKHEISKDITIYEKRLLDLEKNLTKKQSELDLQHDRLAEANLEFADKMSLLQKDKTHLEVNIIQKLEQELSTKNQHLVSLKRDIQNLKAKIMTMDQESIEREGEKAKLWDKVQKYVRDMKAQEDDNQTTMAELEDRFKGVISGKNEKLGKFQEEIRRLKGELEVKNKVMRGEMW